MEFCGRILSWISCADYHRVGTPSEGNVDIRIPREYATTRRWSNVHALRSGSYYLFRASLFHLHVFQGQPSQNVGGLPNFFIVVPGATGVKQSIFQGKDQIIYHLHSEYPADDVLGTISMHLKRLGWEPLNEDWLNPGLPSSHVRGWDYFQDRTTKPVTSARAWNGDWENSTHDILIYVLTYSCPDDLCSSTRNLRDLRVIAIRVPADLAKQMKASLPHDKTGK